MEGLGEGPLGVDGSVSVLPLRPLRPLREIKISMLTWRIGFMQQSPVLFCSLGK